ncbi:unnamed protein product [Caenorhabditis auriculariae]|uniref:IFT140 first beta-propeller domain-containing protein n=1 Tax=Caenorhabditis auriculariae TaxID=2777116 RepID=A0A8S1H923_9PELO|nr:unnamed protein product [Caenorhabditis auriculariae]
MAAMVSNMRFPIPGAAGPSNVTLTIQPSTSHSFRRPQQQNAGRFNHNPFQMGVGDMMGDGPGRRLRKNVANVRRHVDYVSTVLNHAEARLWQYGRKQRMLQQPDELYQNTALPVHCTMDVPVDCILTKFVRAAMNKVKCPVYSLCWSPEGKRLITGASTGEFTLWNGTAFNFETILQAHDSAIRAMRWSSNEQWLLSADQDGYVKYWQPNMNNVHMFAAHKDESVRGLCFAPTDVKFATASDDGTCRVWDFARCAEEKVLRGHGSEVRCIDWHPTKGLIVSGSRDTQQPVKLWDPKSGQCLATFQEHKSSVMAVEFNRNGNWLLTGGRDHLVKMYDIRVMKEMHTYRAHKKEVISVAWHPVHEGLFVSGGGDGSIAYWLVDSEKEIGFLEHAHDQAIWAMRWHPMGHILATGSNDNNTKFWARNRPGDTQEDIFGLSSIAMVGALDKEREPKAAPKPVAIDPLAEELALPENTFIPGMGLDDELYEQMNRDVHVGGMDSGLLVPDDLTRTQQGPMIGAKRTLIKQLPAKKAQRQFERMWNISKGVGAGTDDFSAVLGGMGRNDEQSSANSQNPHENAGRRAKPSLLGDAPTPSLLGGPKPTPSLLGPPSSRPPAPPGPPPTVNAGPWPPKPPLRPPPQPHQMPPPFQPPFDRSVPPSQQSFERSGPQSQQQQQYERLPPFQQHQSFDRDRPAPSQRSDAPMGQKTSTPPPATAPQQRQPLRPTPPMPPPQLFNKMGVPIPPPGLPPPGMSSAMWPLPPPLNVHQQQMLNRVGPPPPARSSGEDVDYRLPPPAAPSQSGDVDLRSVRMPPPINFGQPPPTKAPPKADESWRTSSGAAALQNKLPPPQFDLPPSTHQPNLPVDPRLNDPRLRPRNEEPRQEKKSGWMPQFNTAQPPQLPNPPQHQQQQGTGGPMRNGADSWRSQPSKNGQRRPGGPY